MYKSMKYTPIDDLPNLDDLENNINDNKPQNQPPQPPPYRGAEFLPPEQAEKYQKYIRPEFTMSKESGMIPNNYVNNNRAPHYVKEISNPDNSYVPMYDEKYNSKYPSCLDFSEHYTSCPICSKFYNSDKSLYVIIIIVLSILCILLLKRVLNV